MRYGVRTPVTGVHATDRMCQAQGRADALTVSDGYHAAEGFSGQAGRIGSRVVVRVAGGYPDDGDIETTGACIAVACLAESVLPIIVLKRYAKAASLVNRREWSGAAPAACARPGKPPQRRRKT